MEYPVTHSTGEILVIPVPGLCTGSVTGQLMAVYNYFLLNLNLPLVVSFGIHIVLLWFGLLLVVLVGSWILSVATKCCSSDLNNE